MHSRFFSLPLAVVAAIACLATEAPFALADQTSDEAAIRANAGKYVEAYNRRDARTMASMWSPDAVYTDKETGVSVVGREALTKLFDDVFAGAEDAKLKVNIESVEFVSPNVAIEKGAAEVSYSKSPVEKTQYAAVHVRRDGQWLLDRVTETNTPERPGEPPPSNYEHLKELEWMIGTWIDRSDNSTIATECSWTKNRNFMTRSFSMTVDDEVKHSGMQIVGWDPVAKQIRSWVFDSDGSYNQGTWTRKGDAWLIQQRGTLPDGGMTSATNIIKRLDNDSFTWQSTDRVVDNEIQPNTEEVLIVRQAEE
ncbi:MAG: SgcJ/EcaC family oxidoreductase [Pirellulales bacterium]|nr:SgcJ/EcaC family oxidoreductase [Pirellulales bacterium]